MASEKRTGATVGLAVLVLTSVPGFWSSMLPSLHEVATTTPDRTWIRRSEANAIGLSLALGVAASMLAREPWPLLGAAGMCVYLGWLYESALRHNA